ncbi:MAG: exopolysaccharide biosynthesis protein [Hyphomicrobiales bacterium]|nr:exopolysaccharide biosynthesis protein [Hyphomicrobiales bacterium]
MTIKSLQAGRAIAALVVVGAHASYSASFASDGGRLPFWASIFDKGYLGVDFFFVLSGFIIYYTSLENASETFDVRHFLAKRLIRIFVPYIPIGIGMALAYSVLPPIRMEDRSWGWFASTTLLPIGDPPALRVAWTLQHELVFYFIFAALNYFKKMRQGMIIWMACIIVSSTFASGSKDPIANLGEPLEVFLSPINLEFIFGMIAARMFLHRTSEPRSLLFLGVCAPLAIFVWLGMPRDYSVLVGLSIAFSLVPICRAEKTGRFHVAPALLLLGDASYSIYLIHSPILAVAWRGVARLGVTGWWPVLLSIICISTLAGIAYHFWYERRALSTMRSISLPRPG